LTFVAEVVYFRQHKTPNRRQEVIALRKIFLRPASLRNRARNKFNKRRPAESKLKPRDEKALERQIRGNKAEFIRPISGKRSLFRVSQGNHRFLVEYRGAPVKAIVSIR
jgi:hypothetical protein